VAGAASPVESPVWLEEQVKMNTSGTLSIKPETAVQTQSNKPTMGVFDLSRWKPCTPEDYLRYMSLVAAISAEYDDQPGVESIVEALPDGRTRMYVEAETVYIPSGEKAGYVPYILTIYDPETNKTTSFRRTDVCLPGELTQHDTGFRRSGRN
jgi:hypothetical protein